MRARQFLTLAVFLLAACATVTQATRIYVDIQDCELASIESDSALIERLLVKHFQDPDTFETVIRLMTETNTPSTLRRFSNCRLTFKAVIPDKQERGAAGSAHARSTVTPLSPVELERLKVERLNQWIVNKKVLQNSNSKSASAAASATSRPVPEETGAQVEVFLDEPVRITSMTPWNLDRISLPGNDGTYSVPSYYANVNVTSQTDVYIVDTGVRATHEAFRNTASSQSRVTQIYNAYPATPVSGYSIHGTHVADLAAGNRVLGPVLAARVPHSRRIFDVRVLDSNGNGYFSDVSDGLRTIVDHCNASRLAGRIPGVVVNLSLGGGYSTSLANLLQGIFVDIQVWCGGVVVVSAGNDAVDACEQLPAGLEGRDLGQTITVAAMQEGDSFARSYSNYGTCVTFVQPGTNVRAAVSTCDTCYDVLTGTSMATPNMAALFAFMMSVEPESWMNRSTLAITYSASRVNKKNLAQSDSVLLFSSVAYTHLANTADGGKLTNMPANTPNRVAVLDPTTVLTTSLPYAQKPDDSNNVGAIVRVPDPPFINTSTSSALDLGFVVIAVFVLARVFGLGF